VDGEEPEADESDKDMNATTIPEKVKAEAIEIINSHALGAEMDAGFDGGEWSGPAHAEMEQEALEKLAARSGVKFIDLYNALFNDDLMESPATLEVAF